MTELPEPHVWFDSETGAASFVPPLRPTYEPCYTADTVRQLIAQARSDALEEAAKVCEEYDGAWYVYRKGAAECAAAIRNRALKEKQA